MLDTAYGALQRVTTASRAKREAELEYRAAILDAADTLDERGPRTSYAQIARAAGVTRQSIRIIVKRATRA